MLTSSFACTSSPASAAMTSLAFMFELVPEPVWKTSIGNWSSWSPRAIASPAAAIRSAFSASSSPSSAFVRAAAALIRPEPARHGSGDRLAGDQEVDDRLARLAAPQLPARLRAHGAEVYRDGCGYLEASCRCLVTSHSCIASVSSSSSRRNPRGSGGEASASELLDRNASRVAQLNGRGQERVSRSCELPHPPGDRVRRTNARPPREGVPQGTLTGTGARASLRRPLRYDRAADRWLAVPPRRSTLHWALQSWQRTNPN